MREGDNMKKFVALILLILLGVVMIGGANTVYNAYKEEPLAYIAGVQYMLMDISSGNMEMAMGRCYQGMADPTLEENLQTCAELLAGREIKRCDCYDYARTGNRSDTNTVYTETTYYKIYLTEDYYGEPDLYAKALGISDGEGDGIISFEIYDACP